MQNISIRRFLDHPHKYQGVLVPEDGRWRLVLDADGVPHLFLRVFLAPDQPGWLDVEDLLPCHRETGEALCFADLIDGEAGDPIDDPEELQAAYEEYEARSHVCPVPEDMK